MQLKTVEEEKRCSKCKTTKPRTEFYKNKAQRDGYSNYCKVCASIHGRAMYYKFHETNLSRNRGKYQYRKSRGEFTDAYMKKKASHPDHIRARNIVTTAIKYGRLKRQPCRVCGSLKVHAHHTDYSKPLEVNWLCIAHHMEHHRSSQTLTFNNTHVAN